MPIDPAKLQRFLQEIRIEREAFYRRMAADSITSARRLEQAYRGALPGIQSYIEGTVVNPDAPFGLTAFKARIESELNVLSDAIVKEAGPLEARGAEIGYRAGLAALQRGGMAVRFNVPVLDTIQGAINYVDSPAFRAAVENLAPYHAQNVADLIIEATAQGRNPRETARMAVQYFTQSKRPMVDAVRLTRTTQVYAGRKGSQSIFQRTGVEQWIWSANIGSDRTCIACIVLHGTIHPVTEILNDHHLGRCAPVPITPTWASLGFTGGAEVPQASGIGWFEQQPVEVQQRIMGPKYYEAWRQGKFELAGIPRTYPNEIFGPMRRKATLGELLAA